MANQAGREARANGLPCGEHTYSDPLKIKDNEGGAICEQYGTIANWNAWERVHVTERATGRRVFDNEVAKITGIELHATPAQVLAALNPLFYEVK
jgi:hypothetical protein